MKTPLCVRMTHIHLLLNEEEIPYRNPNLDFSLFHRFPRMILVPATHKRCPVWRTGSSPLSSRKTRSSERFLPSRKMFNLNRRFPIGSTRLEELIRSLYKTPLHLHPSIHSSAKASTSTPRFYQQQSKMTWLTSFDTTSLSSGKKRYLSYLNLSVCFNSSWIVIAILTIYCHSYRAHQTAACLSTRSLPTVCSRPVIPSVIL